MDRWTLVDCFRAALCFSYPVIAVTVDTNGLLERRCLKADIFPNNGCLGVAENFRRQQFLLNVHTCNRAQRCRLDFHSASILFFC